MTGKKRTRSDDATPQIDKRTKINNVSAIKEEEGAFALQPDVSDKIRVIAPVNISEKIQEAITPVAMTNEAGATTRKGERKDNINWTDHESQVVDGANAVTDAIPKDTFDDVSDDSSEDDIEIITGDETDMTLIGSEDDAEKADIGRIDGEEESVDIKLTDETAEKNKTSAVEAAEKRESNEKYSAAGREILFKGIQTSLKFSDLAMWVGAGTVGATETRQIMVDGITVEVTIKLLEAKFDAPTTRNSNGGGEKVYLDEAAADTIFSTTKAPPKLTVDTVVASKSRDTSASSRIASPADSLTVARKGKLPACRFGDQCKKRVICMFDHSQPPVKQMCSFVNTNMGCSKGQKCAYSHEHEGQMCRHGTIRKECPNTFKCVFQHMDDDPPSRAEETSKLQVPDEPAVYEASAADIAERAVANRASREASAASAPPPNAPTGPKSNKRSRGADHTETGFQAQRSRHNYRTPEYLGHQKLQQQQWQSMPGFGLPPVSFFAPPGGYHAPQGQFIPAQVLYNPREGFHSSSYAGNQQQRHGRGSSSDQTRGGGRGRGRGNVRQNDRLQRAIGEGGNAREAHGTKLKDAAEGAGAGAGPSEGEIKVRGSAKKA